MDAQLRRRIASTALIVGFFVAWEVLCRAFGISDIVLPKPSQISWRFQMSVANVGTSVCPAEYSVASPNTHRATTTQTRGLSSSRNRDLIGIQG